MGNTPTGFPASDTSTMSRSQSSSLPPGIRPSRSGITPSWPSSTPSLDIKLKSTPSILHQTPTSSPPVVETVRSTSGTLLKEDILRKSMLSPQLTLSSSPQRSTGSLLVPKKVSRSMISHTRNSLTSTKLLHTHPKWLEMLPRRVPISHQLISVAPPSSGPRTNSTSMPVSPMEPSESSPSSTTELEKTDDFLGKILTYDLSA